MSADTFVQDAKARFGQLIRDEDIDHWHEHGYIVLERFLSPEEIKNIDGAVHKFMPTSEEFEERSLVYQDLMGTSSRITRGSSAAAVRYDFPYPNSELNNLAFHPLLVAFAERLAETDDLQLSISHLVGKYAGRGDFEQALHTDYSNNTLVVPNKGKRFIDIPIITYLTDVTLDLGPTYVVSQKYTEHRGLAEDGFRHHTKKDFPELYEVEKPMVVPAGSTIICELLSFVTVLTSRLSENLPPRISHDGEEGSSVRHVWRLPHQQLPLDGSLGSPEQAWQCRIQQIPS